MTNIYKEATREKLTFTHNKGELQVSQLWDLPIESRSNVEGLKDIARKLDKQIKESSSDLFDERSVDHKLKLKFDVIMDVISTKKLEAENKTKALAKDQEIARIKAALASKEDSKFDSMDEAQLKARLNELQSQ